MANYRYYLGIFLLGAILVLLQYRLWFAAGGMQEVSQLKKAIVSQAASNDALKQANEKLSSQIAGLHNSKDIIETHARDDLGLIKNGETFYQIVREGSEKNENTH
jgi:cell division protein FtsB